MCEKAKDFLEKYMSNIFKNENKMQLSYDIWEECENIHAYSIASIFAALNKMLKIYMFPLHKCQKLQITIRNQRYLYILSTSSFLTVSFTSSTSTLTFLLPNWISIVSPVFTCTDALAGLSLTITRPASATSLARVRRLIRRLTFKYLSKRMGFFSFL